MNLSEVTQNLKMDTLDTEKAYVYLEQHREFRSDTREYPSGNIINCFGSKIFCLPNEDISNIYIEKLPPLQAGLLQDRSDGLKKLASEIEKVKDLICELEFLIRNIPVRDTKVSIHLIVQHLLYLSENVVMSKEEVIIMRKNTPLLALGCVLQSLKFSDFIYIFATNETAVVCYLFTELSRKAGLDCVKLVIADETASQGRACSSMTFSDIFGDLAPEVIGVITEKSDVDSAVDAFLNSLVHPFPLTHIFVQESIYKEFKNIITWKCRSQECDNLTLQSNSTGAFRYETKTIYLDYAGDIEAMNDQKDSLIFVEAYRTTNELLNLLKTHKRLCLSLWASGISEANEIALNANVPVIWINDYYNFDGPIAASQAVFDKTYESMQYGCNEPNFKKLLQLQKAWAALNFNERHERVLKAFDYADARLGNAIKSKSATYWKLNEFISVQSKTMVLGFASSVPIHGFIWGDNCNGIDDVQIWLSLAKGFINGSALAYEVSRSIVNDVAPVFVKLAKCGVPVADINAEDTCTEPFVRYRYFPESVQTKVIWTSFGTTFAN